jgi:CheY-like chemotaxis protein
LKSNINDSKKITDKTVLLGEDNPMIVFTIKKLLEQSGYSVQIAKEGSELLRLLKTQSYFWVLLDIILPELSGIEVTSFYRSWEQQQRSIRTPIFAMTGYSYEGLEKEAQQAGIDCLFKKPFTVREIKTIESFLRKMGF